MHYPPVLKRTILPFLLLTLLQWPMFAQIAIGQWREHLPYRVGIGVAYTPDRTYCATESGLYFFDREDNEIGKISKINGLTDVGFAAIGYDDFSNTLVIAYSNTNIDLIQDNEVINLPDIKNKPILGNKVINNIHIEDGLAYLACGFGIVVLDLVKQEVEDTYYIGDEGAHVFVNDLDINDEYILAATGEGVYRASANSIFLANYQEWEVDTTLAVGNYNAIAALQDKLMVNRSVEEHDTLYWKSNGPWNYFDTTAYAVVNSLEAMNGAFTIASQREIDAFDVDFVNLKHTGGYPNLNLECRPAQILIDEIGALWVADRQTGLVRIAEDSYVCTNYAINGPQSTGVSDISVWDSKLFVASGGITSSYGNSYNLDGIFHFEEEQWRTINVFSEPDLGLFYDVARTKVSPLDSRIMYATTWGTGLVELFEGKAKTLYDSTNSGLLPVVGSEENFRLFGLEVDNDGNVWIGGSETGDLLFCKTPANEWYSYYFGSLVSNGTTFSDIVVDDIGQKWIVAPRGVGLIVFNDGGTLGNTADDQMTKLNQSIGNGNLASTDLFCIAKDLDGEIWVGTNNGLSVFYAPEAVFSGGDFDSDQVLVTQYVGDDTYTEVLLANEKITDIAIDGANQKWIATANAGIFLMSEDGSEEIHHFTTENSPLFSNAINAVAIDHLTGEVYIGTEKGIMSYRGSATYGGNDVDDYDVIAFPNPVEPHYDGPIAIRGLVRDSDIKIADVAGNVVFATTAEGGTAVWNGKTAGGNRARSGVYMVFASNEDGKEALVTKILLIN